MKICSALLLLGIGVLAPHGAFSAETGGRRDFICEPDGERHSCYYDDLSFPFDSPDSFLLAKCDDDIGPETDTEPTPSNCLCYVGIGELHDYLDDIGTPQFCHSCSFLAAPRMWEIKYDCSRNSDGAPLLTGDCVGRDSSGNCISNEDEEPSAGAKFGIAMAVIIIAAVVAIGIWIILYKTGVCKWDPCGCLKCLDKNKASSAADEEKASPGTVKTAAHNANNGCNNLCLTSITEKEHADGSKTITKETTHPDGSKTVHTKKVAAPHAEAKMAFDDDEDATEVELDF